MFFDFIPRSEFLFTLQGSIFIPLFGDLVKRVQNLLIVFNSMLQSLITITLLLIPISTQASDDKIAQLPGYPPSFNNRAFGGYLTTNSPSRSLHYIFMQSDAGAKNTDPVVLWLNGGPGCTSMIGFLQEISAYVLSETQIFDTTNKNLAYNPYNWLAKANLLFIDTPAGVGYSINLDSKYEYNDQNTAKDNMDALRNFFTVKFPEYSDNVFYIAGESYAGKMIPDLAMKVLGYNSNSPPKPIKLKGILMANPLLTFEQLQESRVEFMISHNFVDPRLIPYWQRSCKVDPESAGCSYFYKRYEDLLYRVDEYNIYGECYGRLPQRSLLASLAVKHSDFLAHSNKFDSQRNTLKAGEWCSYDVGVQNYINLNGQQLNSIKKDTPITECNMTIFNNYVSDAKGSYLTIPKLLQAGLKVFIFSGDWDDVVPFTDTIRNMYRMGLKMQGGPVPWKIKEQHVGFIRNYSYGLRLYIVKGAGHEVPLYQRERSLKVFEDFLYA